MSLYQWATGDRITAARLNGGYNLFKGVAGGTDALTLINGSTLDMSACAVAGGFKLPASAGAAPTTDGVLAYDSTAKRLKTGNGSAAVTYADNPMTAQGDTLYGGASGAMTRLAKGTGKQVLAMNAGATAPEWATPDNTYVANRTRQLWLPAQQFTAIVGSPTLVEVVANIVTGWAFDGAAEEAIATSFIMPSDFVSGAVTIKLHWTNTTATAGNVRWVLGAKATADTATLVATSETAAALEVAAPVNSALKVTTHTISFTPGSGTVYNYLYVDRRGDLAGDTLDGVDAYLLGVLIEYTADM